MYHKQACGVRQHLASNRYLDEQKQPSSFKVIYYQFSQMIRVVLL